MLITLCALLVSVIVGLSAGNESCSDFMDCKTCVSNRSLGKPCRWCPLTLKCHAFLSPANQCLSDQVITDPALCRSRNIGKFDNNTAFENILLCASAYTDDTQSCLTRINPKGGFEVYERIAHRCEDLPLFKYKECYAYTAVSHLKKVIVLSYRGSKSENGYQIYDELISILAKPKVPFPAGGKVQEYFFKAHTYLFPCVNSSVTNLIKKYSNYRVIVTGHSLGGALASLAAASLIYQKTVSADRLTLYTFGMPRTGNKQFALIHDILVNDSWRVVHYRDIVSHLPSRNLSPLDGPFHHGVEVFYPDELMTLDSRHTQCIADEDDQCSNGLHTAAECFKDLMGCVRDHQYYYGMRVGRFCGNSSNLEIQRKPTLWDSLPYGDCACIR